MEDGAYNMVLEVSPCVFKMMVDALKIWVKNS